MKKILFFGLILFSTIGYAQTFEGTIIDEESKTVISNAIVSVDGTEIMTTTDLDGMFSIDDELPRGEQVVIIIKDGYEDRYFLIDVTPGRKVTAGKIGLEMTKDERKRRKKLRNTQEKEDKKKRNYEEDVIKETKKQREKEEKRLAKERKKAKKKGRDIIDYDDELESEPVEEDPEPREVKPIIVDEPIEEAVSPLQIKYGALLGVTPEEVTNIKMYSFIDEWMGTPYKMGGANPDGIDCSSFAQRLYTFVYGMYIERTAQKQFDSKHTDVFKGKEYLREGDLIFFGPSEFEITHVGVYLRNNLFVNATSRRGSSGVSGVKISNLSEVYWTNKFVSAGRRKIK